MASIFKAAALVSLILSLLTYLHYGTLLQYNKAIFLPVRQREINDLFMTLSSASYKKITLDDDIAELQY